MNILNQEIRGSVAYGILLVATGLAITIITQA